MLSCRESGSYQPFMWPCRPLLSSGLDTLPNPAGKGRSNGGGEYGAAVAVAAGHADLALAVDELGSAQVGCWAQVGPASAAAVPAAGLAIARA
jgi:hypothetical protein